MRQYKVEQDKQKTDGNRKNLKSHTVQSLTLKHAVMKMTELSLSKREDDSFVWDPLFCKKHHCLYEATGNLAQVNAPLPLND